MPKTRAQYMRKYIRAHKARRRAQLIEMLGGCCVRCGSTEDLEFDHIDPATKRFNIGADLTRSWAELVEEASRCQLLCREDHIAKGAEDRSEVPHGLYRYWYWYWRCRCEVCRAANAAKSARDRARKLARSRAHAPAPGTLDLGRSGVAQSAEHPAVNRVVESSSLSPRALTDEFQCPR